MVNIPCTYVFSTTTSRYQGSSADVFQPFNHKAPSSESVLPQADPTWERVPNNLRPSWAPSTWSRADDCTVCCLRGFFHGLLQPCARACFNKSPLLFLCCLCSSLWFGFTILCPHVVACLLSWKIHFPLWRIKEFYSILFPIERCNYIIKFPVILQQLKRITTRTEVWKDMVTKTSFNFVELVFSEPCSHYRLRWLCHVIAMLANAIYTSNNMLVVQLVEIIHYLHYAVFAVLNLLARVILLL